MTGMGRGALPLDALPRGWSFGGFLAVLAVLRRALGCRGRRGAEACRALRDPAGGPRYTLILGAQPHCRRAADPAHWQRSIGPAEGDL